MPDPNVPDGYDLGGLTLEISADDAAARAAIELRLAPLRLPNAVSSRPAVRIQFVTAACDGEQPAAPPGRTVYETPHGSLAYDPATDVLAGSFGSVRLHCEAGAGRATITAPRFGGRELYLATHPLATIALMELCERRDRFALHAGCLAGPGGAGVLVAGPSGAGKSTLVLALARCGMAVLGDDVIFLASEASGEVRLISFPDAIGLTASTVERFPELAPHAAAPLPEGFPKRLARIEALFDAPLTRSADPVALVFPEVAATEPSRLDPLEPGEALLRLVPDVLLTDATATQAHLAAIGGLLAQVECFTLRSGRDLDRAAEMVRALAGAAPARADQLIADRST